MIAWAGSHVWLNIGMRELLWGDGNLINFIYFFIFGCVGSSLLSGAFSSCGERGLLFVAERRLLIALASLVAEHRL